MTLIQCGLPNIVRLLPRSMWNVTPCMRKANRRKCIMLNKPKTSALDGDGWNPAYGRIAC